MKKAQSDSEAERTQFSLTQAQQDYLLALARKAVGRYLEKKETLEVDDEDLDPALKKERGCFVTLNKQEDLRGCIGHIEPQESLYKAVIDNAINAAVNDHRFNSVTSDELDQIAIEISILTVPQEVEFNSGQELKEKLREGVDGVILKRGVYQSTYLPQVWDQLPDREEFLRRLCRKGGMSQDCWQDPATEVHVYQAFVFSEKD